MSTCFSRIMRRFLHLHLLLLLLLHHHHHQGWRAEATRPRLGEGARDGCITLAERRPLPPDEPRQERERRRLPPGVPRSREPRSSLPTEPWMKRRSSLAGEPRQERERRRLPPGVPRSREPRSNPPGVPRSRETRLPRGVPRSPDCRCWGPRPDSLCARPRALARAASKGAPAITSLQTCGLPFPSMFALAR